MPSAVKKEQRCPGCGKIYQIVMFPFISAEEQPEQTKRILTETLFDFSCSACGYKADFAYPVFYHDKEAQYMIYLSANPEEIMAQKVPAELSYIRKRVTSNLREMKEKILIYQSGLFDIAVEVVKLAVTSIISKKYNDNSAQVFFREKTEDSLVFAIYFTGNNNPVYQSANLNLYTQAIGVLKSIHYKEENKFIIADRSYAQKVVAQVKKN